MTYHSTQSEKSENVSAAKSNSESGTQTGNFGSEHEDPLQEPDSAQRELEYVAPFHEDFGKTYRFSFDFYQREIISFPTEDINRSLK